MKVKVIKKGKGKQKMKTRQNAQKKNLQFNSQLSFCSSYQ
jgi:hypothetical protein